MFLGPSIDESSLSSKRNNSARVARVSAHCKCATCPDHCGRRLNSERHVVWKCKSPLDVDAARRIRCTDDETRLPETLKRGGPNTSNQLRSRERVRGSSG